MKNIAIAEGGFEHIGRRCEKKKQARETVWEKASRREAKNRLASHKAEHQNEGAQAQRAYHRARFIQPALREMHALALLEHNHNHHDGREEERERAQKRNEEQTDAKCPVSSSAWMIP